MSKVKVDDIRGNSGSMVSHFILGALAEMDTDTTDRIMALVRADQAVTIEVTIQGEKVNAVKFFEELDRYYTKEVNCAAIRKIEAGTLSVKLRELQDKLTSVGDALSDAAKKAFPTEYHEYD